MLYAAKAVYIDNSNSKRRIIKWLMNNKNLQLSLMVKDR